jgi:hypothetical protein
LEIAVRLNYTGSDVEAVREQSELLGKKLNCLQAAIGSKLPIPKP